MSGVIAAVSVSGPAPFDARGLDWFAGWSPGIAAENRARRPGGAKDKMVPCAHGEWLAARCAAAELRIVPDAGRITVLDSAPEALT